MSVIVARISSRDGVVASDGRRFGSARFENGKIVQPASVESDEFDKTFCLDGGTLIGAFAGLMSFSGKSIAQHIQEIFDQSGCAETEFAGVVTNLEKRMRSNLDQIAEQEVIFDCRKLDVLLAGGKSLTRRELRIAAVRFFPSNGTITSQTDIISADHRMIQYYLFGEDKARAAANRLLGANTAPTRDSKFLETLAIRAVEAGIRATGIHPYGCQPACGGKVFTKRTYYG